MDLIIHCDTSGAWRFKLPPNDPAQPHLLRLSAMLRGAPANHIISTIVRLPDDAVIEEGAYRAHGIDDDTPLSADVLLAIKEPVGWTIECGWAGGKNTCAPASGYSNGWRHGRATHWSPRPAPPATAATEVE